MSVLDSLPELIESEQNFAYFCKFDRSSREKGKETLFSGGDDFQAISTIGKRVTETLESAFSSGPEIPVIVPYDFITQVFPDSGIRRSDWPVIAGFVPETVSRGSYTRTGKDSGISRSGGEEDSSFSRKVAFLRDRIIRGEILQGVLSRRFDLLHVDPVERITGYLQNDRSLYVFLYRIGKFTVLGSSPENLVTVDGHKAEIFPIAGTVPRGSTPEEDMKLGEALISSEKDKLEHRMLVDLARNDLGKFSVDGSVRVAESMVLRKYSSVQHLVSLVQSDMPDNIGPVEILKSVFPAGTVSGAPKRRAVELIDALERVPRGAYAGALGVIGKGKMDLALLIRSIMGVSGKYYTQAGAGIVKDSDPRLESMEVMSKVMTATGGIEDECIDC